MAATDRSKPRRPNNGTGGGADPGSVPEAAAPFVAAWRAWRSAYAAAFAALEAPVFSGPVRYGGTADALLRDSTGALWLVDYKTRGSAAASALYDTEPLQLAALATADLVAFDGLEGEATPMPSIEYAAVLLLRPDASWRFVPVRLGQVEGTAWQAVRQLHEYLTAEAPTAPGRADEGRAA